MNIYFMNFPKSSDGIFNGIFLLLSLRLIFNNKKDFGRSLSPKERSPETVTNTTLQETIKVL